ncbi:MAG: Fic family protein [Candidatus Gracilibacteria bacterium]
MERFNKRLSFTPDITNKIYGLISQIEELKGQWRAGINLSPQILGQLKRSVIVTSSGASTRIEGAKLSDEEVEKLLKGLKIQKLKTRDEQEVAGYAELLTNVFDFYRKIKFSEVTIKHFHNELLKYSEKDQRHKGNYKSESNRVEAKDADGNIVGILFDPTPPHLVRKEMNELVDWTILELDKKEIHPLIIIGNFIFEFLSIHPFQDGNGRASRILTNLLLLKSGYEYMPYISHEKLVEDNKNDYYLSLNKSQKSWKTKNEDVSQWLIFFLTILLEQTKRATNLLSSESIEHLLSEKQLEVWNYVQEHKKVTPRELQEKLKMPAPTILQTLNKLLNMKKIQRLGEGRGVRYTLLDQ